MEITCKITNNNSSSAKDITLNKFFQIMFIADDFKRIDYYTALVVCQGKARDLNDMKVANKDLALAVSFSCEDDQKTKIMHKEITNSFLSQIECIRGVWGNECKVFGRSQKDFVDYMKECYNELIDESETCGTADSTEFLQIREELLKGHDDEDTIYIKDDKEQINQLKKEKTMIATKAYCTVDSDEITQTGRRSKSENKPQDDKNHEKIYTIKPASSLHPGVSIICWIKTTYVFDKPFDERSQINYVIQFDDETNYYTPDFTFYISPPPRFTVDTDNAFVRLNTKNPGNSADKEPNKIQPVSRSDKLYYNEWKDEHNIGSRKMCRLVPKIMSSGSPNSSTQYNKIGIKFNLSNPTKQPLAFFILSIILSLMLSFGIDSSRLSAISAYFPSPFLSIFPIEILWIASSIMTLFTFFIGAIRLTETKEDKCLKFCRRGSMALYVIWLLYLFWILKIEYVEKNIDNTLAMVINILIFGVLFLSNAIFLGRVIFCKNIKSQYPTRGMFSRIWS